MALLYASGGEKSGLIFAERSEAVECSSFHFLEKSQDVRTTFKVLFYLILGQCFLQPKSP